MSKDHEMEAVNGSLNMLKKGPTSAPAVLQNPSVIITVPNKINGEY
jgi:hypothetical protein